MRRNNLRAKLCTKLPTLLKRRHCKNGGDCFENSTFCKCRSGFSGDFCEISPCEPNPCQGGNCSVINGSPNCQCSPGHS